MKITLIAAVTRDGFINHQVDEQASAWTSPEDQRHYSDILKRYKLQFMGLHTYDAYKERFKSSSLYRRIILTQHPERQKTIPGKIEFTNEPLAHLLKRLSEDGFSHAALLGGGQVFTEFLEASKVDEAFVTIEPVEFGEGVPFLTNHKTMQDYPYLVLDSSAPLNQSGTMLLHYVRKEYSW